MKTTHSTTFLALALLLLAGCATTPPATAQVPPPANAVQLQQRNAAGDDWVYPPPQIVPQPNSVLAFGVDLKPMTVLLSTFATTAQLAAIQLTPGPQGPQGATGPQGPAGDSLWTASGANLYRATGNVGIGTANPLAPLSFATTVADKIHLYGTGYGIGVQGSSLTFHVDSAASGWDWRISAATAPFSNGVSIARLTGGGVLTLTPAGSRIGVAKTPAYPLDVAGDINLTGDIRKNGIVWNPSGGAGTTATTVCLQFTFDNIPAGATDFVLKGAMRFDQGLWFGYDSSDPYVYASPWQQYTKRPWVFYTQSAQDRDTSRLQNYSTLALSLQPASRPGSITVLVFDRLNDTNLQWVMRWLGENDPYGRPIWRRVFPTRLSTTPDITNNNNN